MASVRGMETLGFSIQLSLPRDIRALSERLPTDMVRSLNLSFVPPPNHVHESTLSRIQQLHAVEGAPQYVVFDTK